MISSYVSENGDMKAIIPKYEVPCSYKEIETEIVKNMKDNFKSEIKERVAQLKNRKLGCEIEGLLDYRCISEEYCTNNSIRLKNALHLKDLAESSTPEVKPILYYYSVEQFLNFFLHSIMKISAIPSHGITVIPCEEILQTKIKIRKEGFFSRLVNVYWLFGEHSVFSPIERKYGFGKTEPDYCDNDHNFALPKEKKFTEFTLFDLINQDFLSIDVISSCLRNLILLYVGSHFARYTPYLWKEVLDGQTTSVLVNFKEAYSEYENVIIRHIQTLEGFRRFGFYERGLRWTIPYSS